MTTFNVTNTEPSTNADLIETISRHHFGVNFLVNQLPLGSDPVAQAKLLAALQYMNVDCLRWPGGTVTETVFDFRNENATTMNGSSTMSQHDFFVMAGNLHADISLVLPTRGAFGADHSAALALADGTYGNRTVDPQYITDLKAYVLRTLQDADAQGTHIRLFEIGNEFWGGAEMTATEYGRVARAVLTAVDQVLTAHLTPGEMRPAIGIQSTYAAGYMSPSSDDTVYVKDGVVDNQFHAGWTQYTIPSQGTAYSQVMKIADEVTGVAEGGPNLSRLVTGIIDHYYPKLGLSFVDGDIDAFLFKQMNSMEKRLGYGYGVLERNITEWNPIRYWDANGDGQNDDATANRGMPQVSEMMDMMYELVTHGVHTADMWPLYFAKASYTNLIEGQTFDVRLPGVAFKLMQDSLIGTRPIFDFMQSKGAIEMDVHGYGDAHRLVFMISNQSAVECPDTVLNLLTVGPSSMHSMMGGTYFITSTRLNSVDALGHADPGINTANVDPVLSYIDGKMSSGNTMSLGTLASWDLLRTEVTFVSKANDLVQGRGGNDSMNGLAGNDTLLGDVGNDTLTGGNGNDSLLGGDGNDFLTGQNGNDMLRGEAGNDLLQGDTGNDSLYGGDGRDTLVAGLGNDLLSGDSGADVFLFTNGFAKDTVAGFSHADGDVINLAGMTGASHMASFAAIQTHMKVVGGITHIVFGTDDMTVTGMAPGDFVAADFIW